MIGLPGLRRRRRRPAVGAALLALASLVLASLAVAACASPALDQTAAPAIASASPVISELAVREAIAFRTRFGLRADEAWVLAVAADPASEAGRAAYGTPLTRDELAELNARAANGHELSTLTEQYGGEHSDEWAGGYLVTASGVYVARFTGHLAEHEAALRRLASPIARLEVRGAEWTYAELNRQAWAIAADTDWLPSIHAWFARSGVDVASNRVLLRLSTANPDAAQAAMDHYEGEGWLVVESDGVGRWEGPRGTALIRAVTRSGRPAVGLDVVLTPDEPSAHLDDGYLTGLDGISRISGAGATGYRVELFLETEDEGWLLVGRGRIVVMPDTVTKVTIRVDLP